MIVENPPTLLIIGGDAALHYLLGRFAERSGYQSVDAENISGCDMAVLNPAAIIFLSTEWLARDQIALSEFGSLDAPVLVCASAVEECRAIELGADDCLLHPLLYDDFQAALTKAIASKGV